MNARLHKIVAGFATALAVMMLTGPALADGMGRRGSLKDMPKPEERCKHSANIALTTEYIFRGFSQTAQGPAVQGGYDLTCGIFYAGVWASSLDFAGNLPGTASFDQTGAPYDASIEMDWYIGIKPVTGRITWDLGVIYYSYPNRSNPGLDLNYLELKVGASAEIWKGGTLGVTVFWSPEYQLESGSTWTVETGFTHVFPKFNAIHRDWTPSFSALLGWQINEGNASYKFTYGNGDDSYLYWNVGLTLGFLDKWSLDFRYWDTNLSSNTGGSAFCRGQTFQCDERFVATLKFTY
jgi:uncharacterized protein (TIGR02001 family)